MINIKWPVVTAAVILVLVIAVIIMYNHLGPKPQPITIMPQTQAEMPVGVKQAADAAYVPVSSAQTEEVAEKIRETCGRPPDSVALVAGRDVDPVVEDNRKKSGSDFSIVTDPDRPNEKPVMKLDDSVQLNVYNVKAYPKSMAEVSVGIRGADVAYLRRVDVPRVPFLLPKGAVGYMGPFIRAEYESDKVDGGVRLVITF